MEQLIRPDSLEEALEFLGRTRARVFAGGTDLMVRHRRHGGLRADLTGDLLFIDGISELCRIEFTEQEVRIGAGALLSEIEHHPQLPKVLRQSIRGIAAPALRNRATLGGNICNASPAADTVPALHVLDAQLELRSATARRRVSIAQMITGPGATLLNSDELLTEIIFPRLQPELSLYRKVGTRQANALSKLSVAAMATKKGDNFSEFRIAFGAVAPTVVRCPKLEEMAIGVPMDGPCIEQICHGYAELIQPIDDQRSSARYRQRVALNLLKHSLLSLGTL
ncbi:FAD binding domain-containing protein [Dongshaea marina]|uniref:FAD binding domain-containing protein n=1 Tax=Dongshaea marina TaxID=2047966 RepID=UPI000D3E5346|nr:xanthine dehydrogenase family protein subunit M [Dongshaea marina]